MRSTSPESAERVRRAQERALRAARAVTLTMSAALAGCASTIDGSVVAADVVQVADTPAAADVPVVADAAADLVDAADVPAADVGEVCSNEGDAAVSWSECCDRINWDWRRGCQAWGPFMPPSMDGEAA